MPQYRIFTVDFSGHRIDATEVECADDQEAVQQALRNISVDDVEVWQSDRFIALLPRYEKRKQTRTVSSTGPAKAE
jgi:hypothetical protein